QMEYKVTVATGTSEYSGTNNYIYVTLVGERGESERTVLDNPGLDFCRGAVDDYTVKSAADLGPLILVRLEKQKYWMEDNWFCRYVKVSVPGERCSYTFPCYRWLVGDKVVVELREGTAKKISDDTLPLEISHRTAELLERQKIYRWLAWAPGIPKCIDAKSEADLPQDVRFDNEKRSDFVGSLHYALLELSLKKLAIKFGKSWNDLDDFKRIFWKLRSPIAEYTMKHWKEDCFFGYQFLNGSNPRMITRCKELPSNFLVTGDMVQSSLVPTTTLKEELKKGNIFLVDHAIMDGIPANVIRDQAQHIAAPLCLLYEHPEKGLIPIAIQLEQKPDKDTPIFLPSDPPLAWLLAKMWVRHSEFQVFQLLSHLLRTHLVVEVICVATLRQLPAVHPIYKVRGSLQEVLFRRDKFACLKLDNHRCIKIASHSINYPAVFELKTKEELITLLSVVIFTSTAQHAATNNGQFDWCAWVPNTPCTMRHPPPTDKDAVTMDLIMDTLPDISQSCVITMMTSTLLCFLSFLQIPMGQYVEQYFTEPAALKVIDKFRKDLKELEEHIIAQNEGLELQYLYLCPSRMENSITI
uniref:Arachidonate 12-lipoxygenase, 12S-type-like n=1 Tax=Sinocyclocheilus rhinocerous TaxID=307959 RepID=A0A673IZ02_9TELE